ncbi:MAG: DUF3352 domain-containing protein [Solirubrobacteraceae bacterium]
MLRASALTLTCAVLALTAVACGQSGSGGDADPAKLVPAGAAFYLQAAVQPQGERREDTLAAAGKILRTDDPAAKLRELIDAGLVEEGDGLTWERDFASWLGEDAGVWATNLQADEPSYAIIVASTDAEAARTALTRFEKTDDVASTKRSYDGLDYQVDEKGVADGMIDDFVVIGTEDAFKRTADMREGGESLADADRYKDAVGDLDENRLGHFFFDVAPIVDAALEQDPAAAQQFEQFKSFLPLDKLGPITGSFQANGDGMTLDTVLTGLPDGPLRDVIGLSGGETELFADLPSAWGAFATPKVGESAQKLFSSFAGAIGGAAIAGQVKQATGLDLQQDIFSWVGDVGVFVRGAGQADVDGALVIDATDDAKAATAFGKLVGLISKQAGTTAAPLQLQGAESAVAIAAPGGDKPVILARGEGRVVAAYGPQAATDALGSGARLGDSDAFGAAEAILGDDMKPSFLLSLPDVLKLADAMGATDAEFDKARPYLEALGVVTSGGKVDGDRVQSRVAVTLK